MYKEDLPQLKKKLAGSLKRQKAPDEGLRLQFVHGYIICKRHDAFDMNTVCVHHVFDTLKILYLNVYM